MDFFKGFNTEKGWRETNSKLTGFKATKTAKSQPVKTIKSEENTASKMNVWKPQTKGEKGKQLLQRTHQAGNQTDITSYLPKVKNQKRSAKVDARAGDCIYGKLEKEGAKNIKSMSFEDRKLMKKKILDASNIACTLVFADGSTLLRPGKTKSPVSILRCIASGIGALH